MLSSFTNENIWEWLLYKFVILLTNIGVFARIHNELYLMGLAKKSVLREFIFGLEDIVAHIRILETGSNSCALGEGHIL